MTVVTRPVYLSPNSPMRLDTAHGGLASGTVSNPSATTLYVGAESATTSTGFPIAPGQSLSWSVGASESIWGVAAASARLFVIEEGLDSPHDAQGNPVGATLVDAELDLTGTLVTVPTSTTDLGAFVAAQSSTAKIIFQGTYDTTTAWVPKTGQKYLGRFDSNGNPPLIRASGTVDRAVKGNAGSGAGTGWLMQNIVFDGFAPTTLGAVTVGGTGSVLDHCEIRNTVGTNPVGVWVGGPVTVSHNYVHDNLKYGMGGNGDGATVTYNEIARNNLTHTFAGDSDAGGTKFASGVSNFLIQYNYVHHNGGSGLWIDADGFRVRLLNNLVEFNDFAGIDYEISWYGVISNNIVRYNGLYYLTNTSGSTGSIFYGSDISVNTCQGVRVTGNTVVVGGNGNGIGLISATRGSTSHTVASQTDPTFGTVSMASGVAYVLTDAQVTGNTVTLTNPLGKAAAGIVGLAGAISDATNFFAGNTYHTPDLTGTWWVRSSSMTKSAWQAAGQDTAGTFLTP
jgi:parallel beta-helix repeat protein